MTDIRLISEQRVTKPETIVIAEVEGIMEASCHKMFFRCTCGDKYVSGVWLASHVLREGTGHRRQIIEDD